MDGVLDTIGDAGFISATIIANVFVILYLALARFWRSGSGLHIFTFMLVIALILDHSAVLVAFGEYPGWLWVRAFLYPALGVVLLWRVIILVQVQVLKALPGDVPDPSRKER